MSPLRRTNTSLLANAERMRKKMKNKKLVALFMALAMLFTLAIPAFATEPTTPTTTPSNATDSATQNTNLTGAAKGYDVDITVSAAGKVIVNPYKIEYTPTATDAGRAFESAVSDQIINPGTFITNNTNIPLKVTAQITPTLATGITLLDAFSKVNTDSAEVQLGTMQDDDNDADTPDVWVGATHDDPDDTETGAGHPIQLPTMTAYTPKAAFLAFEIKKCADTETEPTWTAPNAITATTVAAAADDDDSGLMILAAGLNTISSADCIKFAAVGEEDEPSYACFHVTGYLNVYPKAPDAATNPLKVVEAPWASTDTIGAAVVLTFTPDVDASVPTAAGTTPATP